MRCPVFSLKMYASQLQHNLTLRWITLRSKVAHVILMQKHHRNRFWYSKWWLGSAVKKVLLGVKTSVVELIISSELFCDPMCGSCPRRQTSPIPVSHLYTHFVWTYEFQRLLPWHTIRFWIIQIFWILFWILFLNYSNILNIFFE